MKSWLPFWFDLPFVFIVSSLCLHHPAFRKPLSDSIFLPFLPPFCPPFIHYTSEACRGISGSVKRFGSIASSFHLRYHPPLFVILVRKSNLVSPIFSCPFLKLYYTLVLFLSAISFVLFNHSVNLPFRCLASNPFLLLSSSFLSLLFFYSYYSILLLLLLYIYLYIHI